MTSEKIIEYLKNINEYSDINSFEYKYIIHYLKYTANINAKDYKDIYKLAKEKHFI